MDKLTISSRRSTGKSTVVSVRLPDDLVKKLDAISSETGRSRNELLIIMIDFAINHLEIKKD